MHKYYIFNHIIATISALLLISFVNSIYPSFYLILICVIFILFFVGVLFLVVGILTLDLSYLTFSGILILSCVTIISMLEIIGNYFPPIANLTLRKNTISVNGDFTFVSFLRGRYGSDAGSTGRSVVVSFSDGSFLRIPLADHSDNPVTTELYQVDNSTLWVIDCFDAILIDAKTKTKRQMTETDFMASHSELAVFDKMGDFVKNKSQPRLNAYPNLSC